MIIIKKDIQTNKQITEYKINKLKREEYRQRNEQDRRQQIEEQMDF